MSWPDATLADMAYELIFYDDPKGAVPVRDWLRKLSPAKEESAGGP